MKHPQQQTERIYTKASDRLKQKKEQGKQEEEKHRKKTNNMNKEKEQAVAQKNRTYHTESPLRIRKRLMGLHPH